MEGWPEGIAFSPCGRAWLFPESRVIFTQSSSDEPSLRDANGLIEFFLWLESGVDAIAPGKSPIVIHDWRSYERIPQEVRTLFSQRRKEIASVPERLIVALGVNPVLRMALRTVALGTQLLTHAVPLSIVDDPMIALFERTTDAPDPLLHLRLREAWRGK